MKEFNELLFMLETRCRAYREMSQMDSHLEMENIIEQIHSELEKLTQYKVGFSSTEKLPDRPSFGGGHSKLVLVHEKKNGFFDIGKYDYVENQWLDSKYNPIEVARWYPLPEKSLT